jgi:hypothetical protein
MNHIVDDDLPTTPKASVRVAATPIESSYAHAQGCLWSAARSLENASDEELVELLQEPEFYADCTPLERELIVRLSSRLEYERGLGV